jgi:hypothetical protein
MPIFLSPTMLKPLSCFVQMPSLKFGLAGMKAPKTIGVALLLDHLLTVAQM